MSSPTSRTLDECRSRGWTPARTEYQVPGTYQKRDLFGFIDVLALTDAGLVAIQATSTDNASARVRKITQECADAARRWLKAGGRIVVWGWAKRKRADACGAMRLLWTLKEYEVTEEMIG